MAVSEDGRVFGWGNNSYYKMGVEINRYKPEQLDAGRNCDTPMQYDLNFSRFGRMNEYPKIIKMEKKYTMCLTTFDRYFWWGLHPNNDYFSLNTYEREEIFANDPEQLFGLTHLPVSDDQDQDNIIQVPDSSHFPMRVAAGKLVTSLITLEKPKNDEDGRNAKTKFFSQIQCGDNYTMALTGFNELMVWGSNLHGEHGTLAEDIGKTYKEFFITGVAKKTDPKYRIECFPHFINYFGVDRNKQITYFSCGARHVLAIQNDIALYAWGDNSSGQLGIQQPTTFKVGKPTRILTLSGMVIHACEAGDDVSGVIVGKLRELYTCGSNADGKLGLALLYKDPVHTFTKIDGFHNVQNLSIGRNHVMAICRVKAQADNIFDELSRTEEDITNMKKSKGKAMDLQTEVFAWGNGAVGQLGTGKLLSSNYPAKLEIKGELINVSAGVYHSGVVTSDGRLYLWGMCSHLPGNFMEDIEKMPEGIRPPILEKGGDRILGKPQELRMKNKNSINVSFKSVHLRDNYNLVRAKDVSGDKVYKWGKFIKDIGAGGSKKSFSQDNVMVEIENLWAKDVAVSYDHAAMISPDSERIYCWGVDNYSGKLGNTVEIVQDKKSQKQKDDVSANEVSVALTIYNEPIETTSLFSILTLRVDQIHQRNTKAIEDKDAKSNSKSAIANETTMDKSTLNDNSMSQGGERSKAQMKAKYYHLLSDEYLDYLKHAAQQAFLAMVQLMDEYRIVLESRDEAIKKLKNFMFCRITEEPFNLPIRDPWEKKQRSIMADDLMSIVFAHTFTALQFHPCLLVRLIEPSLNKLDENLFDPEQFANFVWQIYGSIQYDERKENLYTNLFDLIVKLELKDATYFNNIRLFEGKFFDSLYESLDSSRMVSIKYSSALLAKAIEESIDREEETEQMYSKISNDISAKTKSLDDTQKPFAFCMWENAELSSRYASNDPSWRIDEFMEKVNNIQRLDVGSILGQNSQGNSIFTAVKLQTLVYSLITKLNSALMRFKDYKDTDKKKNMLGYLLFPLKEKIKKEIDRMKGSTRKRFEMNLNHCFLFLMHYFTGNKIIVHMDDDNKDLNKDNERWITKLNEVIFSSETLSLKTNVDSLFISKGEDQENFLDNVNTKVDKQIRKLGDQATIKQGDSEKVDTPLSPDDSQKSVFKNLILYIEQVLETKAERISVTKSLIYEVFSRIIDGNLKADLYEDVGMTYLAQGQCKTNRIQRHTRRSKRRYRIREHRPPQQRVCDHEDTGPKAMHHLRHLLAEPSYRQRQQRVSDTGFPEGEKGQLTLHVHEFDIDAQARQTILEQSVVRPQYSDRD